MKENKTYYKRFSITMSSDLFEEFDELVKERGQQNRSLAIAELVQREVIRYRQEDPTRVMAGTITLTYFENNNSCADRLIKLRRNYAEETISCQQVMLEDGKLMEIWLLQGEVQVLNSMLAQALSCSNEMTGDLTFTDTLMPPVRHNKYKF
jgi:CopG family nickel-responsive transcriptional regulator